MWRIGTIYASYSIGKSVTNTVKPKHVCRITSPPIPLLVGMSSKWRHPNKRNLSSSPITYSFIKTLFGEFLINVLIWIGKTSFLV